MPESPFNQADRPIEIQTPLGDNVLGLRSLLVQEHLGRPFTIEVELSSANPDIVFDDIVGQPVVVRMTLPGTQDPRYWHAYVSRFSWVGQTSRYTHYRATLVPWLWALTRSADCRIFQEKSVPDIVKQVMRDKASSDFQDSLTGSYSPLEYCVQYRETDFNFVSRLMEQEGITYYFKHTDSKALLVLADARSSFETAPGAAAELPFRPGSGEEQQLDAIKTLSLEQQVQPTAYALNDYNPLLPAQSLLRTATVDRAHGLNGRQIFDFPGEYKSAADGERLSNLRLEELQAAQEVVRGETTSMGLGAGHHFKIKEHPRDSLNREYLVTSVNLHFDAGEFITNESTPARSLCQFTAIPADRAYRTPRSTPKPLIQGPQPAVVTTVSGEEIHTDAYGRVKVQFFWDREGAADEKSSCWVRVAQNWAGKKWGSFFLPRKGHEVLVEFLEGDPDRPIITGSVYNAANKPPYDLPAEKTKSTLKSLSSKGGGGFNEFRIEDKKGSEEIFVHGEKNVEIRVKNDTHEWIGHDRHLVVKNDQVESVENDRHEKIKRDHVEEIGRDHHLTIKGKEAIKVTGTHSEKIEDDVAEEYGKNQSTKVTENYYLKAKNITLEATENITIHVGDSYIAIDSSGIKICTTGDIAVEATKSVAVKATQDFKAEATANASVKGTVGLKLESPAMAELKSANTTVKGDGMLTVQGGLVKIN